VRDFGGHAMACALENVRTRIDRKYTFGKIIRCSQRANSRKTGLSDPTQRCRAVVVEEGCLMEPDQEIYLSGQKLYGDDLPFEKIERWYEEEENSYFDLVNQTQDGYRYIYHRLNYFHLYRHLGARTFKNCLAFGCARGDDVSQLAPQVENFVALEPAEKVVESNRGNHCDIYQA
jgi:hypothetical protein